MGNVQKKIASLASILSTRYHFRVPTQQYIYMLDFQQTGDVVVDSHLLLALLPSSYENCKKVGIQIYIKPSCKHVSYPARFMTLSLLLKIIQGFLWNKRIAQPRMNEMKLLVKPLLIYVFCHSTKLWQVQQHRIFVQYALK